MANKTRRSRAIENGVQVGPKIKRLYNYKYNLVEVEARATDKKHMYNKEYIESILGL